jgi:hypothetical protein
MIQENRQGVTQVNLNTAIVRAMHFPFAPLAEQVRIVAEVERRLPAPEIIAADIAADLEAALEQFATIADDLGAGK